MVRIAPISRCVSRRGFASLIGLLLVLVIITFLMYEGYLKPQGGAGGQRQVDMYKGKARTSACAANLDALRTQMAAVMPDGKMPSVNILRRKLGTTYSCPEDGIYQIDRDGNAYCTLHSPCPDSRVGSVVNLQDPDSAAGAIGAESNVPDF